MLSDTLLSAISLESLTSPDLPHVFGVTTHLAAGPPFLNGYKWTNTRGLRSNLTLPVPQTKGKVRSTSGQCPKTSCCNTQHLARALFQVCDGDNTEAFVFE